MDPERKRTITARLVRRGVDDEKDFDRQFWRDAGHEGRFEAMVEMVDMVPLIRGLEIGDQRLQRSVQTLQRRRR